MKKSHTGWIRNGGKYTTRRTLILTGPVFGGQVPFARSSLVPPGIRLATLRHCDPARSPIGRIM